MGRFKRWLCERYLPAWCRDDLLEQNRRLMRDVLHFQQENKQLRAYINGMHDAMKRRRFPIFQKGEEQP